MNCWKPKNFKLKELFLNLLHFISEIIIEKLIYIQKHLFINQQIHPIILLICIILYHHLDISTIEVINELQIYNNYYSLF